jgi:hypothetical protein
MNDSENNAYNWLVKQGHTNIIFRCNDTPDFITDNKGKFEVKTPHIDKDNNKAITFTTDQFERLDGMENVKVLIFNSIDLDPLDIIEWKEIEDKPSNYKSYRIYYDSQFTKDLINAIWEYSSNLGYRLKKSERELLTQLYVKLCIRDNPEEYYRIILESAIARGESLITSDGRIYTKNIEDTKLIYELFTLKHPDFIKNKLAFNGDYIDLTRYCDAESRKSFNLIVVDRLGNKIP